MICEDSLCRQLNTCKWDMPVSSVYCGNMHYATPQPQSKLKDMSTDINVPVVLKCDGK